MTHPDHRTAPSSTPTGAIAADVLVDGETIAALVTPARPARQRPGVGGRPGHRRGREVRACPAASTRTRTWSCRSAARFSSDTFETGTTAAAAWGGTTTIIDFAVQTHRRAVARRPRRHGTRRPTATAPIDYAFHMIVGDVNDDALKAMDGLVATRASPASSCSWPTPASSTATTARSCAPCRRPRENGSMIMMHAENGIAIDVLVAQALARGDDRPGAPRPDPAVGAGGRGDPPGDRAGRRGRRARCTSCTCRPRRPLEHGGGGPRRRAATCSPRPARSTCTSRLEDQLGAPGFEGAKCVCSPPLRPKHEHTRPTCGAGLRTNDLSVVSHRPLPVLLQGPEGARRRRLLEDPQRHGGRRAPDGPAATRAWSTARSAVERWVEICSTTPARMFGLYPRKGIIAPGSDADIVVYDPTAHQTISRRDAPHERGLLVLRGRRGRRQGRHRAVAAGAS